jgi:ABC-type multidrug transport system fused ATPase/permease subunit
LRYLFGLLRPYRRQLAVAVAVALGAIISVVSIPLLVGHGINEIDSGSESGVILAGAAILAVGVLGALSQAGRQWIAGRLGLEVEYDLRNRYFSHLLDVELGFLERQQTGQLVSRGSSDLRPIRFFLGAGIPSLAQDVGTIVVAAAVMLALDPALAAVTLAPLPLFIGAAVLYQRRSTPLLLRTRERVGELAEIAEENVVGASLVRAAVREDAEVGRFRRSAASMLEAAIDSVRVQARYTPTLSLLANLSMLAVLAYGGTRAAGGAITVGEFASFFTYALLLIGPASTIAYWMTMVQQAVAAGERVREVLEHPPALASHEGAAPVRNEPAAISFKRAAVTRPDGARLLDGIDLEIDARRTIAVIGPPGSGHDSLLGLVNRLYDPDSGSVAIAGVELRDLELASLRQTVATAHDDDFLFSTTVRENIAYGRPDATDEEIRGAAERAQAADFIAELSEGYDSDVGTRGRSLSGGQRERLVLARALLDNPGILLLNNATGSLDAHTRAEALDDLAAHIGDWTTLMISYASRALRLADEVIVIREGRIVARGTHDELIAGDPFYRSLVGDEGNAGAPK